MLNRILSFMAVLLLAAPVSVMSQGQIQGTVTEVDTNEPLAGVSLVIEGTTIGAATNIDGEYTISNVPAGTHRLRASFIGFQRVTQTVEVIDGQTVTVNFELREQALGLEEVVVTGQARELRRREIGTTLASIDVEQLRDAPVISFSQLMQGRSAGVNVLPGGGKAGQASQIMLRGPGSLTQSNSPIIYVDGVRMEQTTASGVWTGGPSWSSLDDLNPADIERVEIIKGAAAATMYGSEASGGVIQIFTKRGRPGDARINYTGEYGVASISPSVFSGISIYGDWFHENFISAAPQQKHSLSFQGSLEGITYYASGTYNLEEGMMPNNQVDHTNLRANVEFPASDDLRIRFNANYSTRTVAFPQDANNIYGYGINGLVAGERGLFLSPLDAELIEVYQRSKRSTMGTTAHYTPNANWHTRFTFGVDLTNFDNTEFQPFGANIYNPQGRKDNYRREAHNYNLEFMTSYQFALSSELQNEISLGFQRYWRDISAANAFGRDFPAVGLSTVSAASVTEGWETRFSEHSAGIFAQNKIGWRDLLFITIGARLDGHSAFGEEYPYELYPKISGSYVISDHDFWPTDMVSSMRLRAAYGTAGQQPGLFDAVRTWSPTAAVDGQPAVTTANLGNPELGPEITHEYELGFEAAFLNDRLNLDFTYYHDITQNALINVMYPPSDGFLSSQLENVGEIENKGFEIALNGVVIDRPNFRWNANVNFSTNENEILDMGDEEEIYVHWTQAHKEGFPLGAFHDDRFVMQDGQVVFAEDDYIGPAFPTLTMQLGSSFNFLNRFNARILFDHAGGHFVESTTMRWLSRYSVPDNDPVLPDRSGEFVATFCRDIAGTIPEGGGMNNLGVYDTVMQAWCDNPWPTGPRGNVVQPADFWKLREVTLSYQVPVERLGFADLREATVYLSGRNLWTWFKSDVLMESETNYNSGGQMSRQDYFDTPLPRIIMGGVRLGF